MKILKFTGIASGHGTRSGPPIGVEHALAVASSLCLAFLLSIPGTTSSIFISFENNFFLSWLSICDAGVFSTVKTITTNFPNPFSTRLEFPCPERSLQIDNSSQTLTMAPASGESRPLYQKDEKTFCFHGELLYEAKITDLKRSDPKDSKSAYEYKVHYKGWKNR